MRTLFLTLALTLLAPLTADAQWSWPERSENLQVLPEDFPAPRLRAVMTGFVRALGVRCSHCHVGEDGQPLSTFDFASDDNPKKRIAREMLNLLGDVNERLNGIDELTEDRVNMWCHTCHRGAARPQTLEEALTESFKAGGTTGMLDRYAELRERYYGRGTYDFGENSLNGLGYGLLREGENTAAIAVFHLNVEQHPSSGNVYDSLAEGYMTDGQPELARIYYQKALEIDPSNRNALEKLRELAEKK